MTNLKIAALSAFAAIGLTSAAVAQPSAERAPQIELPADQKGMMQGEMGGMMEMMKDPEMREQMKEMMRNCSRMMQMKQENMMKMERGEIVSKLELGRMKARDAACRAISSSADALFPSSIRVLPLG